VVPGKEACTTTYKCHRITLRGDVVMGKDVRATGIHSFMFIIAM
jgi:hypothetical protein